MLGLRSRISRSNPAAETTSPTETACNHMAPGGVGWKDAGFAAQAFGKTAGIARIAGEAIKEIEYKQRKCGDANRPVKDLNESAL